MSGNHRSSYLRHNPDKSVTDIWDNDLELIFFGFVDRMKSNFGNKKSKNNYVNNRFNIEANNEGKIGPIKPDGTF